MKISSTNLVRIADVRVLSIDRISGTVTKEGKSIPAGVCFPWNVHPVVARCSSYRYGRGFKNSPLLRFHKISKWKVPFVERTCSVISFFISFFKRTLYPGTYRKFFMTPLAISKAHFFCFCKTCLLLLMLPAVIYCYYIAVWLQSPFATVY